MKNHPFPTIVIALLIFMGGVVVGKTSIHSSGDVGTAVANATRSAITGDLNPDTIKSEAYASTTAAQAAITGNGSTVAFNLNIANLSNSQKALLRTMGITGDTIPITNSMLICVETTLGVERATAIKNGAIPTMAENLKLIACYK